MRTLREIQVEQLEDYKSLRAQLNFCDINELQRSYYV